MTDNNAPSLANLSNEALTTCLEIIDDKFNSFPNPKNLISTGFQDIDECVAGLESGSLVMITGSEGTTPYDLCLDIMSNNLKVGDKVGKNLIIDAKQKQEQVLRSLTAKIGLINVHRLATGRLEEDDWPRLTSAVAMLKDHPFQIGCRPSLSLSIIEEMIKEAKVSYESSEIDYDKDKPVLVIINDLDCITTHNDYIDVRYNDIGRNLKRIALEQDAVIIISNLNVNNAHLDRTDKALLRTDITSKCGPLLNYFDECWSLYDDYYFNDFSPDKGFVCLDTIKTKFFSTWRIKLLYQLQYAGKYSSPVSIEEESMPSDDELVNESDDKDS